MIIVPLDEHQYASWGEVKTIKFFCSSAAVQQNVVNSKDPFSKENNSG